jgi:programmed cell death protein 4
LATSDVQKGFERLLEMVDEYEIDVPGATRFVASFLARAVVDEIVPPRFLMDPMIASLGGEAVSEAKAMLSREHQYSRIEKIWGPGDGRPVEELKVSVEQLLQEFIVSRSFTEAERCVVELQSPHFHHEVRARCMRCPRHPLLCAAL